MRNLFIFFFSLTIVGCVSFQDNTLSQVPRESVLSDNMKICAFNNDESICVAAAGAVERNISWGKESHSIVLIPRLARWHGKLGLTEPIQPDNIWNTKNGRMRVLVTEAEIRYNSIESAIKRLPLYRVDGINVVYNDSGLLVMWRKIVFPDEILFDLSIFQLIINNKKPSVLPGSQNDNVIMTYGSSQQ